jgi:N-acetylglucosamine-6-phosphate deacetylase
MSGPIKGNILTPGGWISGAINYGERVTGITGAAVDPAANGDDYVIPGFIDLHVHGGGGRTSWKAATLPISSRPCMPSTAPPACWPPP